MKTCPAKKGDYFEFMAETDILCALSTCPGGDLSKAMWGESAIESQNADPTLECCRPLRVEVYHLPDGWLAERGWKEALPNGPAYKGRHAMKETPFTLRK